MVSINVNFIDIYLCELIFIKSQIAIAGKNGQY